MVDSQSILNFLHNTWFNLIQQNFWDFLDILYTCWSLIINDDTHDDIVKRQHAKRSVQLDSSDPFSPYRRVGFENELISGFIPEVQTAADIPLYAAKHFGDERGFAIRELLETEQEVQPNGKIFTKFVLGEYHWRNYTETLEYIYNVGDGLCSMGLKPKDSILIFCETRYEWLICMMACFMNNIKVVTIYSTLGKDALYDAIVNHKCTTIITSSSLLPVVKECVLKGETSLMFVIQVDGHKLISDEIPNVKLVHLSTLKENAMKTSQTSSGINFPNPDDIAVIMYTSGSAGTPKAVLINHASLMSSIGGIQPCFEGVNKRELTIISYLPLAHILELTVELFAYTSGLKIGYSSPYTITGRSTGIKKGQIGDMHALKPHVMIAVPMILDRMYHTIKERATRYNFIQSGFFYTLLAYKKEMRMRGWLTPIVDKYLLMRLNKLVFGGQMGRILAGGAPLSVDVHQFIQSALCVRIFQGYGLTETCSAGGIADEYDMEKGSVGPPIPSVEIRLRSWEEGNYRNTDRPEPRGEILVGGNSIANGYMYASTEESDNFVTIENVRYFCTGDIGKITKIGTLAIIDRKKDLIKSKTGEYISLAKIEKVATSWILIDHCCVIVHKSGNVVLLIVPDRLELTNFAEKNGIPNNDSFKNLCSDQNLIDKVLSHLQEKYMKGKLQRFEIPVKICLVTDEWLPGSDFLTVSLKVRRNKISEFYKQTVNNLLN